MRCIAVMFLCAFNNFTAICGMVKKTANMQSVNEERCVNSWEWELVSIMNKIYFCLSKRNLAYFLCFFHDRLKVQAFFLTGLLLTVPTWKVICCKIFILCFRGTSSVRPWKMFGSKLYFCQPLNLTLLIRGLQKYDVLNRELDNRMSSYAENGRHYKPDNSLQCRYLTVVEWKTNETLVTS